MSILHAIILGVIQGLSEFLPISSSAHLMWAHELFGIGKLPDTKDVAFDVALHGGTLIAILVYFWRDILDLIVAGLASVRDRSMANDPIRRLAWFVVIATIPGALFGALLDKYLETTLRAPIIAAIAMIVLAMILLLAERVGRRERTIRELTISDAIVIGLSQAVALVPGVSRSGVTITTGLFRGLERDAAARFSFLLSGPIIFGALVMKIRELHHEGFPPDLKTPFVVGIVTSAVVGLLAVSVLMKYLRTHSTGIFIAYRVVAGIAVIAYCIFHKA